MTGESRWSTADLLVLSESIFAAARLPAPTQAHCVSFDVAGLFLDLPLSFPPVDVGFDEVSYPSTLPRRTPKPSADLGSCFGRCLQEADATFVDGLHHVPAALGSRLAGSDAVFFRQAGE